MRVMEAACAWEGCERSHWGLFDRIAKTVRDVDEQGQVVAYKSLAYNCAGKAVEFRQPLEGSGTRLMHGDFARKISPSEEALATFILKRPRLFHARRVLVVGAGLGFAGLVAGACTSAREVLLTDGDPEVVRVLETSLQLNKGSFDESLVAVQQVLWDRMEQWPPRHSFDLVIGADVVYLEDLHWALLEMMLRVLRPGGQFLLFASRRNGSLEKFLSTAKSVFATVEVSTEYDADVEQAIGRSSKCFPVFAKLSVPAEEAEDTETVQELRRQFAERHAAEQLKAERSERRRAKAQAAHRARSQSLLARRERRLQAQEEEAALPPPAPEPPEAPAPRQPLRPTAEIEGRSDWGLFDRQCVDHTDFKEFTYNCDGHKLHLRRTPASPRISAAAEALTCWALRHPRCFRRRRVLEVGAGQGLPGLIIAASMEAKHVELSDGDPTAVEALADALKLNENSFQADSTGASRLSFGEVPAGKKFDWIIASDILEAKDQHSSLLHSLRKLLKPNGGVVVVGSGTAFDAFTSVAGGIFARVRVTRDYNDRVNKFLPLASRPKLAVLRRPPVARTKHKASKARRPFEREAAGALKSISKSAPGEAEQEEDEGDADLEDEAVEDADEDQPDEAEEAEEEEEDDAEEDCVAEAQEELAATDADSAEDDCEEVIAILDQSVRIMHEDETAKAEAQKKATGAPWQPPCPPGQLRRRILAQRARTETRHRPARRSPEEAATPRTEPGLGSGSSRPVTPQRTAHDSECRGWGYPGPPSGSAPGLELCGTALRPLVRRAQSMPLRRGCLTPLPNEP